MIRCLAIFSEGIIFQGQRISPQLQWLHKTERFISQIIKIGKQPNCLTENHLQMVSPAGDCL
jgi:hypothetical protein